jgi:hypothetical protein
MLQKCIDLTHPVKELQVSVRNYLTSVRHLPAGSSFDIKYCDKKFGDFLGAKSTTGNKNTRYLIENFHVAFLKLDQANRDIFIDIFDQTNNVQTQFANPTTAIRLNNYPKDIRKEVKALFLNLYTDTLMKYGIKDHYTKVYKEKKDAWCPFCGMEKYIHPQRQKQDYDHLLYKANYPVASVNMYNLAPMGIFCNRIFKKTKDLLLNSAGIARSAINPYFDIIQPRINLSGSVMSRDPKERIWIVNITPNSEEVSTWNSVFNISERCKEDFLDKMDDSNLIPEVDSLVFRFVQKAKGRIRMDIIRGVHIHWDLSKLLDEIELERDSYETNYYHEYNFIKYAVFDFLMTVECETYRKGLLNTILNLN